MTFTYKVPKDFSRADEHIGPLTKEHMKTYVVRDERGRVYELYEAVAHAEDGAPCLCTLYDYLASDIVPRATIEVLAKWNGLWDEHLADRKVHGVDEDWEEPEYVGGGE